MDGAWATMITLVTKRADPLFYIYIDQKPHFWSCCVWEYLAVSWFYLRHKNHITCLVILPSLDDDDEHDSCLFKFLGVDHLWQTLIESSPDYRIMLIAMYEACLTDYENTADDSFFSSGSQLATMWIADSCEWLKKNSLITFVTMLCLPLLSDPSLL